MLKHTTVNTQHPIHIAPHWRDLRCQLIEKLELQKGLPETPEATHILLSDRPTIIFRASCFPSLMPLICFYPTQTMSYFASFTWRSTKGNKNKVRVWIYNVEEDAPVSERDHVLMEDPQVLTIVYVPCRHLFVAYCEDLHIRLFSDHLDDVQLLSQVTSPYLITSMCYNAETKELVTGAIGVLAFWAFEEEQRSALSVTHEVHLRGGEFVHALSVEPEGRVLVALCENIIRVFDYNVKTEIRTFQVSQGVSLTCSSANWLQSFLYAGDLAGDVKVWNFDTGSQINQFKAHQSAISSVVSRISVHTLMTASLDGLLKEWNLTTCELLRRVDIGEPVFQMQFISELTFFIRTQYTFSIRTLNNFYQLFSRTKSVLKKLVRVQCGPDKARILATTEDGVCRFLSPVTGEMLFVTWPFQVLEKALDYVYDPDQEELLVTMGTPDIYVLDTSKNPCPTKYILRCTDNVDDKVLCLTYSRLDLGSHTFSFIFSGYKSGRVRSVTQHLFRMGGRKLHDGRVMALSSISAAGNLSYHSRESSYLCSYGADEYIILSNVTLKRNSLMDLLPLVVIPSPHCRINRLLLIPGYICVLTEQNRVRLWRQADLVPGKKNPFWKESDAMHPTTITSFDYCYTLNMLVTGGADGSVRIWDILGQLLVEFDTSLKFSRVCFANQRGDLVVGGNKNVYFIPCVTYLPSKHLKTLAALSVPDDAVESPLPFLPCFLLSFNIVFVPKYRQVGKQAKKYESLEPISNCKQVVIEKSVAKVVEFSGKDVVLPGPNFYGAAPYIKEWQPEFAVEYHLMPQAPFRPGVEKPTPAELPLPLPLPLPPRGLPSLADGALLHRRVAFQPGRTWPIAPDGFVPNSVIRAHLFPKGTPPALTCSLQPTIRALPLRRVIKVQMPEGRGSEHHEKARKKKGPRPKHPSMSEGQHRRDLLSEIVSKPWLRHKPSEMTLPCITKAILDLMDDVPYSTYLLCSTALVQIAESYELGTEVQEVAFNRLIQDTDHKEVRMRLAAWEALGKMDLLTEKDVVPLARALLDENKKVRDLARSLLDSVAGITDKFVLKKEMQRLAETSLEDLTQLPTTQEGYFPRRVRAAGIVAETQDEAVFELTEGARRLMNRVDSLLTANLFLTTECPPAETRRTRQVTTRRKHLAIMTSGDQVDDAKPETHGEAQTRWLGLFGKDEKKAPKYGPEGAKPAKTAKAQQPRVKGVVSRSSEALLLGSPTPSSPTPSLPSSPTPSSISSIFSSTSSSGSSWEELRQARRALRAKKRMAKPTPSQEKRVRLPKLAHPILLQRRDTRTQLYSEMLKHQYIRKEKQAATQAEAEKGEGAAVPIKPSQQAPAPPPTVTPKGSFINPKQQYSPDKTKWRNDLYKLLMLRISPAVEGRTAAEDFMASAQMALGGRALSWDLFSSLSQSLLLTPPDKVSQEPAAWKKYLDKLLRIPGREGWSQDQFSQARLGVRERPPSSKSVMEGPKASMEDLAWEMAESDEEGAPGKKKRASRARKDEGQLSGRERKKILKRREKIAREAKVAKEKEQEVPVARESDFLLDGREWDEALGKARRETVGKEREVPRGREREVPRGREREVPRGREREVPRGREQEVAKEVEVAEEKEEEVARAKELEVVERKSRVRRRPWKEEPVKRSPAPREIARRKEEPVEEKAAKVRRAVDDWALAWERALKQAAEGVVAQVMHRSLIQVRKIRLAEAREKALGQVQDQAKVEAGEMALERAREIALAVLKDKLIEDVRAMAMAEAQKVAMAEAREKLLSETRQALLAEVRVRALAEAQAQVLAEGLQGVRAVARIRELADARAMELAEARALKVIEGMTIVVDEERVLELASEGLELAEERAMQLAEEKVMEMSEESIWELVKPKIEQMVKMRAQELEKAKLSELHSEEEQLRKESHEEHLRRANLEVQLQKEDLALRLRRELLEAQIGKEGLQVQLKMEGVASQLRKEGLELQVQKEALEKQLEEAALEAQLREAGLEVPLSPEAQAEKEAREAQLREEALALQLRMQALEVQLSLEAQLRKEALEEQLRREALEAQLRREAEAQLRREAEEWLRREALGESPEEQAEREQLEGERRPSLSSEDEREAEALWEDLGEEAWALTVEEKEALLAVLEEKALGSQMDFQTRAQLLLDILSGPERLDASDTSFQQRLFQVVSLLEISSSMEAEDLAEALLQKAQELLQEAEGKMQDVSEKSTSVLLGLRRVVEAHRPRDTDPRTFASRMRALLKTALAVLRAKSLKERLKAEFRERALWEKTEKEWKKGEDRVLGKRALLDKKLKQALAHWQAEQDRAEQKAQELQRREKRRLKFRTQPILLGVGGREGRRVAVEGAQEGEERGEEAVRRRALLRARQRQTILMWSLTPQRQLALKAVIPQRQRVWKPIPTRAGESVSSQAPVMARAYRIPKNSLYLLGKPLRQLRPGQRFQSRARHHIFCTESKTIDWESFMKLYQALLELKAVEGGTRSAEWQERSFQLLDLYGVSNPLVRALLQRLLVGDYRRHKYVSSSLVRMDEASLGQRILYELVHHSAPLPPKSPHWQGVIPLSYQNNVHTLKPKGTSSCGTTSLKWQTCFLPKRPSKLRLFAVARSGAKKMFAL